MAKRAYLNIYFDDWRGNVFQLTDANQLVVAQYTYDAFGNSSGTGAQSGQPYRYQTKEVHSPSGLYCFGCRYYSPGLGRWLNRDPVGEACGVNIYGYLGNNPVHGMILLPCR